jgi:hypothetical protein
MKVTRYRVVITVEFNAGLGDLDGARRAANELVMILHRGRSKITNIVDVGVEAGEPEAIGEDDIPGPDDEEEELE